MITRAVKLTAGQPNIINPMLINVFSVGPRAPGPVGNFHLGLGHVAVLFGVLAKCASRRPTVRIGSKLASYTLVAEGSDEAREGFVYLEVLFGSAAGATDLKWPGRAEDS